METLFHSVIRRDDTGKRVDNDIPNGLSCDDVGTGMVLAAHELVYQNRARRENAGNNGFAGEDKTELYSRVVGLASKS